MTTYQLGICGPDVNEVSALEPSRMVHSAQERNMKISKHFSSTIAGGMLAMAASFVGPASAQGTPDQRSACMGDAFRFCSADIPNVSRIEACLGQNRSELNPACRAEFEHSGNTRMRPEHFR
jgi:hypothetical protein